MMRHHKPAKKTAPALHNLRVVFFGTPAFALPSLDLLASHTSLIACVTQPDKPVGRAQKPEASAVKHRAQALGIPVVQPVSPIHADKNFYREWQRWQADIAIVVAYGHRIPHDLLADMRFGFLNIHPSLLPQFRGPTPIPAAILAGLPETGVSIMKLDDGMDTGPILQKRRIPLAPNDTTASVTERAARAGAQLLLEILPLYINGTCTPTPQQDKQGASVTRRLRKNDGLIQWNEPVDVIERKIRALSPWPGTYTLCKNIRVKILRASFTVQPPGHLRIEEVQPEGKKAMSYDDFLRGYHCELPPVPIKH